MKASFSTSYSGSLSTSSMLKSMWYSLGVLSCQNLIFEPRNGRPPRPCRYSSHQPGIGR